MGALGIVVILQKWHPIILIASLAYDNDEISLLQNHDDSQRTIFFSPGIAGKYRIFSRSLRSQFMLPAGIILDRFSKRLLLTKLPFR